MPEVQGDQVKPPEKPVKLFISYCWKHRKEAVREMAEFLATRCNFSVWIDTNNMVGSTLEAMAKGIDEADLVILCFCDEYKVSENCKREAEYAVMQNKAILPLRVQREVKINGWLGMILGQRLWVDFSNDQQFQTAAVNLVQQIQLLLNIKQAPAPVQPPKALTKFKTVDVPCFAKFFERKSEEQRILQEIKKICQKPKEGVLVISGGGGCGKTSLLAHIFSDATNSSFFQRECNVYIAVWLNCFQWRDPEVFDDEAEQAFINKLLQLSQKAALVDSSSSSVKFLALENVLEYFESQDRRLIFLLDDVHNPKLLEIVFRQCSNIPCCAMTHDLSARQSGVVKKIYQFEEFSDYDISKMLAKTYELDEKLSTDQINTLASRCYRLPLIANLFAARFEESFDYDTEYQMLLNERISDLGIEGSNETILQLFEFSVIRMESKLRKSYQAFLFFDPAELVSIEDLGILWGFNGADLKIKAMALCSMLEKKNLIRRSIKQSESTTQRETESDSDRTAFLVHELLYDAALENARKELKINSDNALAAVRFRVVTGSAFMATSSPKTADRGNVMLAVLCEAIKRERRGIIDRIVRNLTAQDLFCLFSAKSTALTKGITFLHHLYNTKWLDNISSADVKRMYGGINHSYRLIAKFLAKMQQHNVNYIQLFREKSPITNDSLIYEIYDGGSTHFDERKPLKQFLNRWQFEYREEHWKKKEIAKCNTILLEVLKWHDEPGYQKQAINIPDIASGVDSHLIIAARLGYLDVVKIVCNQIDAKVAIMTEGEEGRTALMYASKNGRYDVVQFLYETCPECVSAQCFWQRSALSYAAESGHLQIVKFLSERAGPESADQVDYDGRTPLMLSSENGHLDCIQYLHTLMKNESFFLKDSDGSTAAILAATNGHLDSTIFLVQKCPLSSKELDKNGRSVLMHAAKGGNMHIVSYLLGNDAEMVRLTDKNNATALTLAAANGHLDVVKLLFEKYPDAGIIQDKDGLTPLMIAAWKGHIEVAVYLADKLPETLKLLDKKGQTSLIHAVESGFLDLVTIIYEKYPDAIKIQSNTGLSPLMLAAYNGDAKIVKFLGESCPEVIEFQNKAGSNVLTMAAQGGSLEAVQYIYDKYPDNVLLRNNTGATPLTVAKENNRHDIVKFLSDKILSS